MIGFHLAQLYLETWSIKKNTGHLLYLCFHLFGEAPVCSHIKFIWSTTGNARSSSYVYSNMDSKTINLICRTTGNASVSDSKTIARSVNFVHPKFVGALHGVVLAASI